jgi:hypothetical protein
MYSSLLFLQLRRQMEWIVNATPQTIYPGKYPVPIVQEAGWDPGPVWTGAENLASTGIRSPNRPHRSESLYRLRHLGPLITPCSCLKFSVVTFKCSHQTCDMTNAVCEVAENSDASKMKTEYVSLLNH